MGAGGHCDPKTPCSDNRAVLYACVWSCECICVPCVVLCGTVCACIRVPCGVLCVHMWACGTVCAYVCPVCAYAVLCVLCVHACPVGFCVLQWPHPSGHNLLCHGDPMTWCGCTWGAGRVTCSSAPTMVPAAVPLGAPIFTVTNRVSRDPCPLVPLSLPHLTPCETAPGRGSEASIPYTEPEHGCE